MLLYGFSYQNIYSIASIFRITHPVKLIEKLIRWWWALFGWLHGNYQYRLRLIFYGDSYKHQDTFFVNRHIFFETLFFLSQRFACANPRLYVIRWYGKTILISTDCTCIIHCARTLSLILTLFYINVIFSIWTYIWFISKKSNEDIRLVRFNISKYV